MQRGTEGEIKVDKYVGKGVSLSSCFFFGHRSFTDLRDKLYYVSGLYLALFLSLSRAESVIFIGLHTVRFSRCNPCWLSIRFLRMCHDTERRRLDRKKN